jgi:hypothetical protein
VKKIILLLMTLIPLATFAQESSVGLRLGEPLSITYKTFLDENFSVEGLFGRAGVNSAQYYRRSFENNRPSANAFYSGHSAGSALSLSGRIAYNEDFTDEFGITEGYLLGYAGVGAQIRSVRVDYAYTDTSISPINTLRDSRRNIDFGPEVYGGGEYYFDDLPLNVFAEIGLFMELLDRFGHLRLQGAIGVRYIF